MKTKMMETVCGLFLWLADVLPDFIQDTMSVSTETALSIAEDLVRMALRGIEKKRREIHENVN